MINVRPFRYQGRVNSMGSFGHEPLQLILSSNAFPHPHPDNGGPKKLKVWFSVNGQCVVPSFSLLQGRATTQNWEFLIGGHVGPLFRHRADSVQWGRRQSPKHRSFFCSHSLPIFWREPSKGSPVEQPSGDTIFRHRGTAKAQESHSVALTNHICLIAYHALSHMHVCGHTGDC